MDATRRAAVLLLATSLAVPAEGIRHHFYYDPPGILSVCYGSTTNVDKTKFYSLDECKARLNTDMLKAIDTVESCVPGLPERVLAAFADAVYNIGAKIACNVKQSTAARMLKSGDVVGACNQLPRWNKSNILGIMVALPGLTRRRVAELKVCLGES